MVVEARQRRGAGRASPGEGAQGVLPADVDARDAVIHKDLDGVITQWNDGAERLFGFAADEIIGQKITRLIPVEQLDEEAFILATVARGRLLARLETTRRNKAGHYIPVALTIAPIRDRDGAVIGAVKIARRLGRLRRVSSASRDGERVVREELIRVARLNDLGKIAAALAHDVHQPLMAISTYASGLRRCGEAPPAAWRDAVEGIAEQSERARAIVQTLRDFARGDGSGKQEEDLRRVFTDTGALSMTPPTHQVRLVTKIEPGAELVLANRVQLQQVLFNLMRNAIEAMQDVPERVLSVSALRRDDMVEITVADTGPGLPEPMLFGDLRPVASGKPDGLGVGLSICRMIVEAHQGALVMANRREGGAAVSFTIPAARLARHAPGTAI